MHHDQINSFWRAPEGFDQKIPLCITQEIAFEVSQLEKWSMVNIGSEILMVSSEHLIQWILYVSIHGINIIIHETKLARNSIYNKNRIIRQTLQHK